VAENSSLKGHDKYVLPTDRVIGVKSFYSRARAYPIQVMQVHQVANDLLPDNEPVNVTYDPLAECARAFSSGTTDHTDVWDLYAVSGLSYKGQSLLYQSGYGDYDKGKWQERLDKDEDQFLYWPLAQKSLTIESPNGTASDRTIFGEVDVLQWRDWLAMYPDTTIVARQEEYKEQYKENAYGSYYQIAQLPGPVVPILGSAQLGKIGLTTKSRGIGIKGSRSSMIFIPYDSVLSNARYVGNQPGTWTAKIDGIEFQLRCRKADVGFTPATVWLLNQSDLKYDHDIEVVPMCFLYAWYSTYPKTKVLNAHGELVDP
jgi:hypothetical protein